MEINLFMLLGILFIALVVQYAVEAFKGIARAAAKAFLISGRTGQRVVYIMSPILSMTFAIGLCILAGLDLFVAFGYPLSVLYVGSTVTGIIASLGAGKIYDLILDMRDYKDKLAIEKVKEVGE